MIHVHMKSLKASIGRAAGLPAAADEEEEEEGSYKILPANTASNLSQSWQSSSNHHEI